MLSGQKGSPPTFTKISFHRILYGLKSQKVWLASLNIRKGNRVFEALKEPFIFSRLFFAISTGHGWFKHPKPKVAQATGLDKNFSSLNSHTISANQGQVPLDENIGFIQI